MRCGYLGAPTAWTSIYMPSLPRCTNSQMQVSWVLMLLAAHILFHPPVHQTRPSLHFLILLPHFLPLASTTNIFDLNLSFHLSLTSFGMCYNITTYQSYYIIVLPYRVIKMGKSVYLPAHSCAVSLTSTQSKDFGVGRPVLI